MTNRGNPTSTSLATSRRALSRPRLRLKVAFKDMADHRAPMTILPRRKVLRVAVALVVLAVVGAAIGIGMAVGSSPSGAPVRATGVHTQATSAYDQSLPEVESCTGEPGAVVFRPTGIGCGLDAYVSAIDWTSWTPTSASGTGTFHQDTCDPDCATGAFKKYKVVISLSDPGEWLGRLVFEEITVVSLSDGTVPEHVVGQTGSAWGAE
jgi:hypothetical protein